MKFFFNPDSLLSLPDYGIQIPLTDGRIHKICDLLERCHIPIEHNFDVTLSREDLERVHTKAFVDQLYGPESEKQKVVTQTFELINPDGTFNRYEPKSAKRPLGDLIEKVLHQTCGTMSAVKEALNSGEAFHLGGGYHHSMSFGGRGFCMLNDIVIAARWSQKNLGTKLIWIIDVDAHKGDGTAELTHNDPSIRTLSIHMKHGWPLDSGNKTDPWFIESDVEIGIEAGQEASYINQLQKGLNSLAGLDQRKPDLAIVVQGSDPYEKDQLPSSGLLRLTKEQMLERDKLVYEFLKSKNIPQAYVMAGGYGDFAWEIYCEFISKVILKRA
jgi:acetoin utilization deacetylase AcuC-like enzyme